MKKVLFAGLTFLMLTSCKEANTHVATIKPIQETIFEVEAKEIEFVLNPVLNSFIYNDNDLNIEIKLPNFDAKVIDDYFINWSKNEIQLIKDNYIYKSLKIDYVLYPLSDNIVNIKYEIIKSDDTDQTFIVKTFFVDTLLKDFVVFNDEKEEEKNELIEISKSVHDQFIKKDLIAEINDQTVLDYILEPSFNNFKNFVFDTNEKNVIIYFDEEKLGQLASNKPIEIVLPIKSFFNLVNNNLQEVFLKFEDEFNREKKYISLTFDDGPNLANTPLLIEGLKQYDVKATFFLVGYSIDNNPDLVVKLAEAGHELGNHSYSHKDMSKLKLGDVENQINLVNEQIANLTGKQPNLFRPPYGMINESVLSTTKNLNMGIALWNVDPKDWQYRDKNLVVENILNNAKNGCIVLMHDLYGSTVEATLEVIPLLKEQGYEFLTFSELINIESEITGGIKYYSIYENRNSDSKTE